MTGGQMLDIAGEVRRPMSGARGSASRVVETQRKKTAEFIAAAVVAGVILGGASMAAQRKLQRAGMALGMLFQTTDDLLDAGQASEAGRATMVSLLGRGRTTRRAASQATEATRQFRSLGAGYEALAAFPDIKRARVAVTVPASGVTCESVEITWIFSKGTPVSSAVICRSDSRCPPPRSGIPQRTTALPSSSMPIQQEAVSCRSVWRP